VGDGESVGVGPHVALVGEETAASGFKEGVKGDASVAGVGCGPITGPQLAISEPRKRQMRKNLCCGLSLVGI
jgi:hypothetical protein